MDASNTEIKHRYGSLDASFIGSVDASVSGASRGLLLSRCPDVDIINSGEFTPP